MLEQFFPSGISQFLIGGIFVGLGISFIFLTTGLIAGASTFFTSTWGYLIKRPYFLQQKFLESRNWRMVMALSMVLGGFTYILLFNEAKTIRSDVQLWRLAIGGLLIGIGTRMADGCPSGHGICGLASRERTSLVAVAVFLLLAIFSAFIVQQIGVSP